MPQVGEITTADKIGKGGKRHKYVWSTCEDCGKGRWVCAVAEKPTSSHCQSCEGKRRMGNKHPRWKGGRFSHSQGYIVVRLYPDDFFYSMANGAGYVFEHRLIVAKTLGRCLHSWEIVHHKHNRYPAGSVEDKQDNRYPENLQLVTDDRHIQITLLERKIAHLRDKVKKLENENKQLKNV